MKSVAQTVIAAESFYTIAAKTGSVIQAVETKEGGDIRLGKYEHKPEQEWAFVREGDGVYRIRNRANGTWLHLWEDVGGTSQMWTVEPTPAGTVRLRSNWAGGKCIDTVGMGTAEGAILQIWQETPGDDQLWTIAEVKDRAKRAAKTEEPKAAEAVKAEPAKAAEPVKAEAPAAAPVAAVEEKPAEKAAEKPAEPAAVEAKTEAPAAAETPAEAPKAAAKAPAKKPAAKKPSRAARKAASTKKTPAKKK